MLWPRVPLDEVPVGHITNGVHLESWMTGPFSELLTSTVGAQWQTTPGDPVMWSKIVDAPDADLWRVKNEARADLVEFARRRARKDLARRHSPRRARGRGLGPRPGPADDRLHRSLRGLQAPDAAAARPRATGADPEEPRALGADRLRGQGPPQRRGGQATPAGHDRVRRHVRRVGPRGLHRGLRHDARPAPGPGCRPLAQHAAASARGLRRRRDEGGHEWGA